MRTGNAAREIAEDRQRRDRDIAEERERREREREEERSLIAQQREDSERRIAEMRRQMEQMQQMFNEQSVTAATARGRAPTEPIKLTRLTEVDDIESYLITFERIMAANKVGRERWSFQLAPYLTGKAYAALPPDDAKMYDTVKEAILRRYDINEETYRQRFRKLRPKEGEYPQELITRLRDLATRWARESKTRDELLDLVVREQFLAILPEDIRVAVIERQPKDSDEAGKIAGNYIQARSMTIGQREKKTLVPTTKCPRCGKHGHWARDCTKPRDQDGRTSEHQTACGQQPVNSTRYSRPQNRDTSMVRCYNCNELGHFSSSCPKRSLYCGRPKGGADGPDRARTINGVYCSDNLVDTGATQTMVHKDLVTGGDILDGEVTIRCAHGDTTSYPLAVVKINIGGKDIVTTAAVSSTLPASVLLRWDIPQLTGFVADTQPVNKADALAVLTRKRRQEQQAARDTDASTIDAQTSPLQTELNITTDGTQNSETDHIVFNFDDSLFTPAGPSKSKLTRAQKRQNRRQYRSIPANTEQPLDITTQELCALQDDDKSLHYVR